MEQTTAPAKKNKAGLIIGLVAGILVVLGIVAAVLFFTVFNRLDVMKFITIKYDGEYEGRTYATVAIDYVELAKELDFEELKDIKKFEKLEADGAVSFAELCSSKDAFKEIEDEFDLDLEELYDLGKALRISIKNEETALSNGDTVKITVKIKDSADFKKKLVGGELEQEVSGLKTIKAMEIKMNPKFYGLDGSGLAEFYLDITDYPWAAELGYSIYADKDMNLTNGDVITASVSFTNIDRWNELALQNGYELKDTYEYTLTVSGLSEPLTVDKFDQTMLNKFVEQIMATEANDFPALPYTLHSAYFVEDVDYADYDLPRQNYLILAFDFAEGGKTYNHIRAYCNPYIDSEGTACYTGSRKHILSGNGWNDAGKLNYINYFRDPADTMHTLPYVAAEGNTDVAPAN
ncbi:MAG: hypothetical protein IIW23_00530 [Clostridia bacterium]|nr:hypothetical protein [Clostridia bacterium]